MYVSLYYAMSGQPCTESLLYNVWNATLTHCHMLHVTGVFLPLLMEGPSEPHRLDGSLHGLSSVPEEGGNGRCLGSDRSPTMIDKRHTK